MVGGAAPHGRPQVTPEGHVGRAGQRGETWATGEEEEMDGLRWRGSSGAWHHGGLEHRHTRPWGLVQHGMRRGLYVYGRVGEGRGKSLRKPERKIEANEVEGVIVISLIGPTQGLRKRRWLRR